MPKNIQAQCDLIRKNFTKKGSYFLVVCIHVEACRSFSCNLVIFTEKSQHVLVVVLCEGG